MKKERIISLILVLAMVISMIPTSLFSKDATTEAAYADGIYDEWKTTDVATGNEKTEIYVEDGVAWRRFTAGEGNDNNKNPGVFLNESAGEKTDGTYSFTIKSLSEGDETRTGVYLRYTKLTSTIFVGYDKGGWFWQVYDGVDNPWYQGARVQRPEAGTESEVKITLDGDNMSVTVDGKNPFGEAPVDVSTVKDAGKFGAKVGRFNSENSDVLIKDIVYQGKKEKEDVTLTGKVTDKKDNPIEGVSVTVGSVDTTIEGSETPKALTDADGKYSLANVPKVSDTQILTFSKEGYKDFIQEYKYEETNLEVDVTLELENEEEEPSEFETLKNDTMEVEIDKAFPRVIEYTMLKEDGKVLKGQINKLSQILVNSELITPEVSFNKETDEKATYVLSYNEENTKVPKFKITIEVTIEDNTLEMHFTEIKSLKENPTKDGDIVRTIEIPNHSLVSVNSDEKDSNLFGGKVTNNTRVQNGDVKINLSSATQVQSSGLSIGVISNNDLSATLYSNTVTNKNGDWNNTMYNVVDNDGVKYLGLSSAEWVYQKGIAYKAAEIGRAHV